MLMTCPHCNAAAKLAPNPARVGFTSAPRYRLTCSGCAETTVGDAANAERSIRSNILTAA
ncbi:hypothetical protein [Cryobacterium melibiosiphilum]|uniref:hypothetical protein n=1 Tax=Cryobacterium melibiosiphilum TaxID=995039 RepID=UPI0011C226ED|nr:hypothetical protein [Cryobacterium melibiosiphilum]